MSEFLHAFPDHYGWAWWLIGFAGQCVVIITLEASR